MLSPYLLPIEAAALIFPFVALALFVPVCLVHFRRYGRLYPPRALTLYAFLLFLIAAFFLTLLPLPGLTPNFCERWAGTRTPQLIPFASFKDIVDYAAAKGLGLSPLALLKNRAFREVFFNFLLLLPLGVFLRFLFKRTLLQTLGIAFATTLFFEVTQLTGIYGIYPCPYRLFSVDDLLFNTTGALLGFVLAAPLVKAFPRLSEPLRVEEPLRVSRFRRLIAYTVDWTVLSLLESLLKLTGLPELALRLGLVILLFIAVPYFMGDASIGKRLSFIKLASVRGEPVSLLQLVIRYSTLLIIPMLVGNWLAGYPTEGSLALFGAFLRLVIGGLEVVLLFGLLLFRQDRRGIYDLLAGTKNVYRETAEP